MDSKLVKEAAAAITQLRDEKEALQQEYDRLDQSIKLAFVLFKQGNVSAENLESLFHTLSKKSMPELEVMEKAAEFQNDSDLLSFGSISDRPELDSLDPLTRLLVEDI